jgi:SAM-dependent methyltransferase
MRENNVNDRGMTNNARDFFDSSASRYASEYYGDTVRSFMTVRMKRMLAEIDALRVEPGSFILDAGCGPGHLLAALTQRGFKTCGVDTSPAMLREARARLAGASAHVQCASIEKLPFPDETFDVVSTAGVVEYLAEDRTAITELRRVLRPGGYLLLPITNFWSHAGWLDFMVEALKRARWIRNAFNLAWTRLGHDPVRPRPFVVRRQRPRAIRTLLVELGLEIHSERYFYFLPWPHPFDRLFPHATAILSRRMEAFGRGRYRSLGEGLLIVSRKGGPKSQRR